MGYGNNVQLNNTNSVIELDSCFRRNDTTFSTVPSPNENNLPSFEEIADIKNALSKILTGKTSAQGKNPLKAEDDDDLFLLAFAGLQLFFDFDVAVTNLFIGGARLFGFNPDSLYLEKSKLLERDADLTSRYRWRIAKNLGAKEMVIRLYRKAISSLEKMAQLNENKDLMTRLATLYVKKAHFWLWSVSEDGTRFNAGVHMYMKDLTKALELDSEGPAGIEARHLLAKIYLKSGSNDKALENINKAVELFDNGKFLSEGVKFLDKTSAGEKVEHFEKLINLQIEILDKLGKTDELIKAYDKLVTITDLHHKARNAFEKELDILIKNQKFEKIPDILSNFVNRLAPEANRWVAQLPEEVALKYIWEPWIGITEMKDDASWAKPFEPRMSGPDPLGRPSIPSPMPNTPGEDIYEITETIITRLKNEDGEDLIPNVIKAVADGFVKANDFATAGVYYKWMGDVLLHGLNNPKDAVDAYELSHLAFDRIDHSLTKNEKGEVSIGINMKYVGMQAIVFNSQASALEKSGEIMEGDINMVKWLREIAVDMKKAAEGDLPIDVIQIGNDVTLTYPQAAAVLMQIYKDYPDIFKDMGKKNMLNFASYALKLFETVGENGFHQYGLPDAGNALPKNLLKVAYEAFVMPNRIKFLKEVLADKGEKFISFESFLKEALSSEENDTGKEAINILLGKVASARGETVTKAAEGGITADSILEDLLGGKKVQYSVAKMISWTLFTEQGKIFWNPFAYDFKNDVNKAIRIGTVLRSLFEAIEKAKAVVEKVEKKI